MAKIESRTISLDVTNTTAQSPVSSHQARGGSPKKKEIDVKDKMNGQEYYLQLHDAVRDGDLKLVEHLIKERADINKSTKEFGDTALHWAVMGGTRNHDLIVKKLVSEGAEVIPSNMSKNQFSDNHTPLHLAASRGSEQCMKFLLGSKDVNINVVTTMQETPLHKAAMAGRESNVKKLLEMGADINSKDKFGNTALHHGAYSGDHNVVKRLMEAGASRNAVNSIGDTPVDRAKTPGIEKLIFELSPDREDFYQDGEEDD